MRRSKYPKDAKTLGEKIRKRRLDLKLDLEFVAHKASISQGYLSKIEAGKQIPKPEIAKKIAEVLGIETKDIVLNSAFNLASTTLAASSVSMQDLLDSEQMKELIKENKDKFKFLFDKKSGQN